MLCGAHAELNNITDDHRFIKTRRFFNDEGKPVFHEADKKTQLMTTLVKLRKQHQEVRDMLSDMIVMSQPSGYVDAVIMNWHLEEQAKRYPLSIALRDLFTGAYCEKSRACMAAINQLTAWIMSKMTPVLQLTDTTAARPFKLIAADCQEKLRSELRAKALAEDTHPIYKSGAYEVWSL